jgi:hypothetical protein
MLSETSYQGSMHPEGIPGVAIRPICDYACRQDANQEKRLWHKKLLFKKIIIGHRFPRVLRYGQEKQL